MTIRPSRCERMKHHNEHHNERRPQVQSEQQEGHHKDSSDADADIEVGVILDRQILLVEHVEHTGTQEQNIIISWRTYRSNWTQKK